MGLDLFHQTYFYVLLFLLFGLGVFALWKLVFDKRRVVKVIWFEKVGKNLMFKGSFKAFEHNTNRLGLHLVNKGLGFHMSYPDESEFLPFKGEKVLPVTRFSSDDWRILTILRDQLFYRKVDKPIMEKVKIPDPDNEGLFLEVLQPKTDKNGKVLTHVVEEEYSDPMGITQEGREVSRFNRMFHQEMDELRKKEGSWWSKYGSIVINAIVIVAFMVFCIFLWKQNAKLQEQYMVLFDEKADGAIAAMNEPSWVEKIMNKVENKELVADAPLT